MTNSHFKKYIIILAVLLLALLVFKLAKKVTEPVITEPDRILVSLTLSNETLSIDSNLTVSGYALHESGDTVSDGLVTLSMDNTSYRTGTDKNGSYSLTFTVPNTPGVYNVTVEVSHNKSTGFNETGFLVVMPFKVLWEYNTKGIATSVYTGNLDEDSFKEVVVYTSRIVSYLTTVKDGKKLWERNISGIVGTGIPTSSGMNLLIDDLNNDGEDEIVAASTCMGYCLTFIYLYDKGGNAKWRYGNASTGSIHSVYVTDLDNDGKKEILYGSYEGSIYALNDDGSLVWEHKTDNRNYSIGEDGWFGVWRLTVSDINNDGEKEVVAGSGNHNIYVLSNDGQSVWNFTTIGEVYRITTFDLDGDGFQEIIASVGGGAKMTGMRDERGVSIARPVDSYLYVLNNSGKLLFRRKVGRGGYSFFVEAADLNEDGKGEIVVGYSGIDSVNVFDSEGNVLWKYSLNDSLTGLSVSDLNGDGLKEIIAGSVSIHVLDYNGNMLWQSDRMPPTMIHTDDLNNDGKKEVVALSSGKVYILGIDF